jgi:hypothetical protein
MYITRFRIHMDPRYFRKLDPDPYSGALEAERELWRAVDAHSGGSK